MIISPSKVQFNLQSILYYFVERLLSLDSLQTLFIVTAFTNNSFKERLTLLNSTLNLNVLDFQVVTNCINH